MNSVKTHKDLDVWKESMTLVKEVYELTKGFPREETCGLASQMRCAAVSIPSNIAEGAARSSDREFVQFLRVSLGSLPEPETQLLLCNELGLPRRDGLGERVEQTRKMLLGLIRYLRGKSA